MPRPKEDEKKKSKSKKVDTADVPESGKLKKPASKSKEADGSSKSRPTKDSSTGSLKGSSSKATNGKEAKERWAVVELPSMGERGHPDAGRGVAALPDAGYGPAECRVSHQAPLAAVASVMASWHLVQWLFNCHTLPWSCRAPVSFQHAATSPPWQIW